MIWEEVNAYKLGWRDEATHILDTFLGTSCKGIIDLSRDDATRLKEMVKSFNGDLKTFKNSQIEIKIDKAEFERCYSWKERAIIEECDVKTVGGKILQVVIYNRDRMHNSEFRVKGTTECGVLRDKYYAVFKIGEDLFNMISPVKVSVEYIKQHDLWLFVGNPTGWCYLEFINSNDDIPKKLVNLGIELVFTEPGESQRIIAHTVKIPKLPEIDSFGVDDIKSAGDYSSHWSDIGSTDALDQKEKLDTFLKKCTSSITFSASIVKNAVLGFEGDGDIQMHYQCRLEIFSGVSTGSGG